MSTVVLDGRTPIGRVLQAVLEERAYQDKKYGPPVKGRAGHELPGWLLVVEKELNEAKEAATGHGRERATGRHTTRAELVQIAAVCIAALEQHGLEKSGKCPKCGIGELQNGYGLAGGGMGSYSYCTSIDCGYFDKVQDPELGNGPKPVCGHDHLEGR